MAYVYKILFPFGNISVNIVEIIVIIVKKISPKGCAREMGIENQYIIIL